MPQLIDEALRQRREPIVELHDVRTSAEFEMLPLDEFEHQTRAYSKGARMDATSSALTASSRMPAAGNARCRWTKR